MTAIITWPDIPIILTSPCPCWNRSLRWACQLRLRRLDG